MHTGSMIALVSLLVFAVSVPSCTDSTSSSPGAVGGKAVVQEDDAGAEASASYLWASRLVELPLQSGSDALPDILQHLQAIETLEGPERDAEVPFKLSEGESKAIYARLKTKYNVEWVRGYMLGTTRHAFAYSVIEIHLRSIGDDLANSAPSPWETAKWPAWIESHRAQLGMK